MKVISLWRPWPWLIVHGGKRIENRPWRTPWRGCLLLAAAQRWDPRALEIAAEFGIDMPSLDTDHPTGIVGAAVLDDICSAAVGIGGWDEVLGGEPVCRCGRWAFPSQYHWRLGGVHKIDPPVPHHGHQGIRTAPRDIQAAVLPYLRGAA